MRNDVATTLVLPPDAHSVRRAREAVRDAFRDADPIDLADDAVLAVSELATNAVLHAGTEVTLRVWVKSNAIRVELGDGSVQAPVQRPRTALAGTGRGLTIVEEYVDRWGVTLTATGKSVWFEIGDPGHAVVSPPPPRDQPDSAQPLVRISLLRVPLLMHWAWQEHASSLLREYLLYSMEDDPAVLELHAAASEALRTLEEQVPQPMLPADTEELMVSLTEPGVTADEVVLVLRAASLPTFETLDRLLADAVAAATLGGLLGPPTQPEIRAMPHWLCGEIAAQAAGAAAPTPWRAPSGPTLTHTPARGFGSEGYRGLAPATDAVVVTDEDAIIVAVSDPAVAFLGYRDASELLGRRILDIIPERYHQAYIAGITMYATCGRDALLNDWVIAPVVRADGGESPVELRIEPRLVDGTDRAFVATFEGGA